MNPDLLWRLLSGGMGLWNVISQANATKEYEGDQDQLRADVLDFARTVGPETLNTYDDSSGQQLGTLQDIYNRGQAGTQALSGASAANRGSFLQDLDARSRGLVQGYQDRYNTAAQDIEGYGRQMQADIDKTFDQQQGQFRLNPLSRGSTIGSTVSRNIDLDRSAEQRRLGEDLTRQRVNLLSGLSGDTLAAQGGADASRAAYDSGLRNQLLDMQRYSFETGQNNLGNISNYYGGNASNRAGLVNQGLNTYLSALSNYNLMPPQPADLSGLGAGLIQPVQPQVNPFSAFLGGAAPGIGAGAGYGLASAFMSDRNIKEDIRPLSETESEAILRRVEELPVSRWKYKGGWDQAEHIGPMAQDFGGAFKDTPEATFINPLDAIGVLLAAVKALSAEVRDLKAKVAA